MENVSIDTLGPLPPDMYDNKYIIVIIDEFSRFTTLHPTTATTAIEYVQALLNHCGYFGVPKRIRTDGSTQFTANIVDGIHQILKVDHLQIVAYHPQANGIVERVNSEIMKHLRALVIEDRIEGKWGNFLPLIQRIINTTYHSSLKFTPATVLFGRNLESECAFLIKVDDDDVQHDDYVRELMTIQSVLIQLSKNRLDEAASDRESNTVTTKFNVNDWVLLTFPNNPPRKLSSKYRGPFRVVKVDRPDLI